MRRAFCYISVPVAGLLAGCSSAEEGGDISLIDEAAWVEVHAEHDPFWQDDSTDESVVCSAQSWETEGGAVEVNTTECNYLTLSQPTSVTFKKGDTLSLSAWWQTLASDGPAIGHIAVRIGDLALLDEEIQLPAEADARDLELAIHGDIPAGTPIYFHVHNHGFNSWTLGSLSLLEE